MQQDAGGDSNKKTGDETGNVFFGKAVPPEGVAVLHAGSHAEGITAIPL